MDIDTLVVSRAVSSDDCPEVGLAAFIVGSLCHEGYVPLDLKSSDSKQDFLNSIRLVAVILTETKTEDSEFSQLPFDW